MEVDSREDLKDFQTPSSLDPGLERIIKGSGWPPREWGRGMVSPGVGEGDGRRGWGFFTLCLKMKLALFTPPHRIDYRYRYRANKF